MSSENIATVIKMIESLPETAQKQVVEHLREYIENFRSELEWNDLVQKTQSKLINAAKQARQEMSGGLAKPMDYDQL
jgi:type I site-specific restriction endonuclease